MAEKTMTPTELGKELDVDPKRIRQYLRSNFARTAEAKNTSWALPVSTVKAVREHFAPKAKDEDKS